MWLKYEIGYYAQRNKDYRRKRKKNKRKFIKLWLKDKYVQKKTGINNGSWKD